MADTIIKRDGTEVGYDKTKIIRAVEKAGATEKIAQAVANAVTEYFEKQNSRFVKVEDIQDEVEKELIHLDQATIAKDYIRYRYQREIVREHGSTVKDILDIINGTNEYAMSENSNKNPVVIATQRDYIAGEVSKFIGTTLLLPKEVVEADKEGVIHYHDKDYMLGHLFNCFGSMTKFITNKGIKCFKDCADGEEVEVLDKNGKWRKAVVRKYGQQSMQEVLIQSGRTQKTIKCTSNHRWLLKDGTITTELKVNDRLALLPYTEIPSELNNDLWCFGFILGDGSDHYDKETGKNNLVVRLCGNKIQYLDKFIKSGYHISKHKFENDDMTVSKYGEWSKQDFIKNKCWRYLSKDDAISLFLGYYAADGAINTNFIATANDDLAQMIREISALAGYHICSENLNTKPTNFAKERKLYEFRFMQYQPSNRNWIVKEIVKKDRTKYDVWCVEEPITHSFTLDGGIVTGNCCLVNLEDMLSNGTVITGNKIDKPKHFLTACNIATQIMAQVKIAA